MEKLEVGLINLKSEISELKAYIQDFKLWKRQWDNYSDTIKFHWEVLKFERTNQKLVPDKSGIYAFFVEPRLANFPSHAYLMYIGLAGYKSDNTLRKRYQQYLNNKIDLDRSSIYWLLNNWEDYIYFYYCDIDGSAMNLKEIETKLLDTFLPPYVKRGFSTRIKNILGAF